MRIFLIFLLFIGSIIISFSQQDTIKGYIIEVKDNKVYVDYTVNDVNVGDILHAIKVGGYFAHPVTGTKIKEEDEVITRLKIIDAKDSYSVAITNPSNDIIKMQIGMRALIATEEDLKNNPLTHSIAIHSLNVMGAEGTYLGLYMRR